MKYRPDIDGLRAVAILGVVAYHAGLPGLAGGFLGVDVFFVISGFLITQILLKQIQSNGRISIADFYARRARRLLPALLVVLIVTLLVGQHLLVPPDRAALSHSAFAALGFVANILFWLSSDGYFDRASDLNPLLHLWSLSVEEQFYLIYPVVLLTVCKFAPAHSRLLGIRLAVSGLTVASLMLCYLFWRIDQSTAPFLAPLRTWDLGSGAFYLAPTRAWELGIGALLALWQPRGTTPAAFIRRSSSIAGMLLIIYVFLEADPRQGFHLDSALLVSVGTALVIWGNAYSSSLLITGLLTNKVMVRIGVLSYGWYLWHWPMMSFAQHITLKDPSAWLLAGCAIFSLLAAMLTLKYIENPIRYGTWAKKFDSRRSLYFGAGAMLASSAVMASTIFVSGYAPKNERDMLYNTVANDMPDDRIFDCIIIREEWHGKIPADRCIHGDTHKPISVAVWGDSHAMAWIPMFLSWQQEGSPAIAQLTVTGCQPLASQVRQDSARRRACAEFSLLVMEQIRTWKAQGLKGVVLAGRWSQQRPIRWSRYEHGDRKLTALKLLKEHFEPAATETRIESPDALREGLAATLSFLETEGLNDVPRH